MSNSVSIIIATFNDADNLAITLESVRQQRNIDDTSRLEVIVSDGGSRDATPDVLAEYSDIIDFADSRPDSGVYDGMNLGAQYASHRFLHFLNAGDTFCDSTSLAAWAHAVDLEFEHHAWIVSGAMNLRSRAAPAVKIPNIPHSWLHHAMGLQPHCHQASWFRRDIFEAIGGYSLDWGMAGDFDLILKFGMISRPLEIPAVLIHYAGGGMSEIGRDRIPRLLHEVRAERMNISGSLASADFSIAKAVGLINRARGRAGTTRERVRAVLSQRTRQWSNR